MQREDFANLFDQKENIAIWKLHWHHEDDLKSKARKEEEYKVM